MSDPNSSLDGVQIYPNYNSTYFSFQTGFEPEANVVSTSTKAASFTGYEYFIHFADGSSIGWGIDGDISKATFVDDGRGNMILTASTVPISLPVNNNVTTDNLGVRDPSGNLVVTSGGQSTWANWSGGSIFGPNFISTWLGGNNNSIGPAENTVVTVPLTLQDYGGNDSNLTGGEGDDTIYDLDGGEKNLAGGVSGQPTGNDTFIFGANVIIPGTSQRSVTIAGTDSNFFGNYQPGEINTIQANGNNDFSQASIFRINRIVFNGATALTFGGGQFHDSGNDGFHSAILPSSTIVGDAGPNTFTVWVDPQDISAGHANANGGDPDLSQLVFTNWTPGQDSVVIVGAHTGATAFHNFVGANVDTTFVTGFEAASFQGGAGNDLFIVDLAPLNNGPDSYDGGGGTNTIDFSRATSGVGINLATGKGSGSAFANGATFANIQKVIGSPFNDTFTAGAANETFVGGGGGDTAVFSGPKSSYAITFSGGNYFVSGGGFVDTLTGISAAQFADTTVALTPPPVTALMIMRASANGNFEIYDIGGNSILGAAALGNVGLEWKFGGLGGFNGNDTADMILRDALNGNLEVYDISNNQLTGAAALGNVGLEYSIVGFGDFSTNPGETDMLMRNATTGQFEVYDIHNNQLTGAAALGQVGPEWVVAGFGSFSGNANETDMLMRNSNTGAFEVYDISHNQLTGAAPMGQVGQEFTVVGFGDFSSNANETDMLMRNTNTGDFEVYDISHNQLVGAAAIGQVGLEWQIAGFGNISGNANESDMLLRNSNTGAFEVYDISHNQLTSAAPMGQVGQEYVVNGIANVAPAGAASDSTAQLVQAMASLGSGAALDSASASIPAGADTSLQTLLTTPQSA